MECPPAVFYWKPENGSNFGDALNAWMWPRLCPELAELPDGSRFLGIGTVLTQRTPLGNPTLVFGSGAGLKPAPSVTDTWNIYCVRGPKTANRLGLDAEFAVTDPAALLAKMDLPEVASKHAWGYMPHWLNAHDGWKRVCTRAGGEYLDPREDVETVLQQLRSVRLVVAEAMHGAIVADALRIPWIAVRASARSDEVKWEDWASSLEIPLEHHQLPELPNRQSANLALRLWQQLIERRAVRALEKLVTNAKPQLSDSNVLADRLNRLEALLENLKRDINQRRFGYAANTEEEPKACR